MGTISKYPGNTTGIRTAIPAQPAPGRGFLAVIDGPAGAGKTTITGLTAKSLAAQGIAVLATRQPSDSPIGELARASTHHLHGLPLTFLMAADRHHYDEHVIAPALAGGKVVVCDRYVPTALVLDQIDGADPDFVWMIYRRLRWPDLAVILRGDPATCRSRAQRRGLYSRFHEDRTVTAQAEACLYDRAAALLASHGYPVHVLPAGDHGAREVAAQVTALITRTLSRPREPREGARSS